MISSLVTWRNATFPSPILGEEESHRGLEIKVWLIDNVSTMIVLLKGPTSTVATSQFESITSSTMVEFPKSSNAPEFLIDSYILSEDRGSNGIVRVRSESAEVMFTVGPEGEFSENATSEPEEATTEEFGEDSRILVD